MAGRRPIEERAVSELVGYLLVFAVVIGGTVLVSTAGLSLLAETGDGQAVAERELERLAGGVDAVTDGAPHRELRLEPRDGAVAPGKDYSMTVTATGGGVVLAGPNAVTATGESLRYEPETGTLWYAGGLVASDQVGGGPAVVRSPPDLRLADDRLVVSLPATDVAGSSRVAADRGGSIPVVLERGPARVIRRTATTATGDATNMTGTLRIEGPAAGAWRRVLADRPGFSPTDLDGDGTDEYAVDTDGDGQPEVAGAGFETHRLYVRIVDVTVRLGATL